MKLTTLLSICLFGGFALSGSAFAAVLVNDGSYINQQWSTATDIAWSSQTGTGGSAPSLSGGKLLLTMQGATGGTTSVYRSGTTATDFILTTRVAIDQFPDASGWGAYANFNGIQIANAKQDDYLVAQLTASQLRIASWPNGGAGTIIDITTEVGKFYTWQFQVSQVMGTGTGTVTIYRRENDTDAWSLVGEDILMLNADFGDAISAATIIHNGDNTQTQGILRQEYFLAGVAAIPEPSTVALLLFGSGAALVWRARRRGARAA